MKLFTNYQNLQAKECLSASLLWLTPLFCFFQADAIKLCGMITNTSYHLSDNNIFIPLLSIYSPVYFGDRPSLNAARPSNRSLVGNVLA